jgi:starch phosphorylase
MDLEKILEMRRTNSYIGYFSNEIHFHDLVPTVAGGLGILAGDMLRSAADMQFPMVGVTLLPRKGYFHQQLLPDGTQIAQPVKWRVEDHLTPTGVKIKIPLQDREVTGTAWRHEIKGCTGGKGPIICIDTDLPENTPYDRTLTDYLYGGDKDYRLAQEILLGIGGARMLDALGYKIFKHHINEGHAAFIAAEMVRKAKEEHGNLSAEEIHQIVRNQLFFTTHTPVPAGHDKYPAWKIKQAIPFFPDEYLGHLVEGEYLNMTLLGLYFSAYPNGVAINHGRISRDMFPEYPIDSITNGIHSATWASKHMQAVFDKHIPAWRVNPQTLRYALNIPAEEIDAAQKLAKMDMNAVLNSRYNAGFDNDIFTIGFARRSASYKRGDLLTSDHEQLIRIYDEVGPFQIVEAGKAHPQDEPGKELIKTIFRHIEALRDKIRIVYPENYDIALAKLLVSGVDLWLNNPRKPMEASGTSGMKAAVNGVPQLSTLDGWWLEGCFEGITGWAIGDKSLSTDEQDRASLYEKLPVPINTFYNKPGEWREIKKNCIGINASFFNSHRMLEQYANAYLR